VKQQQPHYRSASATGSSSLSRWLRLFAGFSAEPSLRTIRDFYAMFVPYRGLLLVSEALASVVSQHLKKQCQKRMVINAFHLIHGGFPESNALWHCSSPVINKIILPLLTARRQSGWRVFLPGQIPVVAPPLLKSLSYNIKYQFQCIFFYPSLKTCNISRYCSLVMIVRHTHNGIQAFTTLFNNCN